MPANLWIIRPDIERFEFPAKIHIFKMMGQPVRTSKWLQYRCPRQSKFRCPFPERTMPKRIFGGIKPPVVSFFAHLAVNP